MKQLLILSLLFIGCNTTNNKNKKCADLLYQRAGIVDEVLGESSQYLMRDSSEYNHVLRVTDSLIVKCGCDTAHF